MKHTFSVVAAPTATTVLLAGEFNGFVGEAMTKGQDGVTYTLDKDLPPGIFGYKFVLDGVWTLDPNAPTTKLVGGTLNSAIIIANQNVVKAPVAANVHVTAANTPVLGANEARSDATITNYGAKGCFLKRGTPAEVGKGIYLAGNGGSYSIDAGNLWRGRVDAICAGSDATDLAISEGNN